MVRSVNHITAILMSYNFHQTKMRRRTIYRTERVRVQTDAFLETASLLFIFAPVNFTLGEDVLTVAQRIAVFAIRQTLALLVRYRYFPLRLALLHAFTGSIKAFTYIVER